MKLKSSAFAEGGKIPSIYTCEGKNISPPLQISEVPAGAKSLVLIMDDPDVPTSVRADRMWVHWVVYNIPPSTALIGEGATPPGLLGKNTGGQNGYYGPCPPDREHRYFFKLYALDISLKLPPGATKAEVEKAMAHHIVGQAQLMGLYEKQQK